MIIWKPQIWYIYVIDENIKRLRSLFSFEILSAKLVLTKSGGRGGGERTHIPPFPPLVALYESNETLCMRFNGIHTIICKPGGLVMI
jgi:hypothetical protein